MVGRREPVERTERYIGDSVLEKGLRAMAWAVLAATVSALVGMGLLLQPPNRSEARANTITTDWVSAANTPGPNLEDVE